LKAYVLIALAFALSEMSWADNPDCSKDNIFTGEMFELFVRNSLADDISFRFCVGEQSSYLISALYQTPHVSKEYGIWPAVTYHSQIKLTVETQAKIDDLYKTVLLRSRPDNVRGMDGSQWCFRPKSGNTYNELCFWSPTVSEGEEDKRGMIDISNLGTYLFDLSELANYGAELQ
jgi:hypothetical protein|tara:strand:- start:2911 stop:3435 length:525 start_codon:yes stop_codon:yes gene_type:complete